MSLNLLTALQIQRCTVRCFALGPFPNGKYGSVCYLMSGNFAKIPILSIESGEFDNCKAAIDKLEDVVKSVRELDLPAQEDELSGIHN